MTDRTLLERPAGRVLLLLARLAFWAAAATLAYALCRRGLTLSDEGDLLSGALAILGGKVPYRDLDLFVTPGAWYLNAAIFALTGPSVIATRIAAAGCLLATMAVTRRIVRVYGGPLWGDFGAGLIAIFAVWAWPAWTWSFYSPWATLLSMTALATVLEWMRSRRSAWLVACGIAVGLAIAFKQNYGVFAGAGCTLAVLFDEVAVAPAGATSWRQIARRTWRATLLMALGACLVLVPGILWLAREGALPAAFDLLVLRPFGGFIDSHSIRYLRFGDLWRQAQVWTALGMVYLAVPVTALALPLRWSQSALSLTVILHVALYWIPLFAFAGLGLHGLLRIRDGLPLHRRAQTATVVFAAAYFLGVFPRADFNHLINVYQPVLAMLAAAAAVHFGKGRWRSSTARRACAVAVALVLLCFAGMAALWMNGLRKTLWIPLEAPRAGVLVEGLDALMLDRTIDVLRMLTADHEPVFALPNLSMIPFLAERPMPTRFHNYYSVHIGEDGGLEAAREIEASEARVVLADYENFFADPARMVDYGRELAGYLHRTFRPAFLIGEQRYLVLVRRNKPLDDTPWHSLWGMCDIRIGGFPATYVRDHLLFSSLYHSFRGAWATYNQGLTPCQLLVPAQARLKLWLELRQREPATEPATARAEVWLFPRRGRPRRLLQHEWSLSAERLLARKAGKEFDIDLSRWAGQDVNILLRTVVDGKIPQALFDPVGFSVIWNDARIESRDYADDETKEPRDRTADGDEPQERRQPADAGESSPVEESHTPH